MGFLKVEGTEDLHTTLRAGNPSIRDRYQTPFTVVVLLRHYVWRRPGDGRVTATTVAVAVVVVVTDVVVIAVGTVGRGQVRINVSLQTLLLLLLLLELLVLLLREQRVRGRCHLAVALLVDTAASARAADQVGPDRGLRGRGQPSTTSLPPQYERDHRGRDRGHRRDDRDGVRGGTVVVVTAAVAGHVAAPAIVTAASTTTQHYPPFCEEKDV